VPTSDHNVTEARRQSTMATSRLEYAILQAVIDFNQKEQLSREQIVMALINVAGYWQKKIILTAIQRKGMEQDV
jgi:hypothetical protein